MISRYEVMPHSPHNRRFCDVAASTGAADGSNLLPVRMRDAVAALLEDFVQRCGRLVGGAQDQAGRLAVGCEPRLEAASYAPGGVVRAELACLFKECETESDL